MLTKTRKEIAFKRRVLVIAGSSLAYCSSVGGILVKTTRASDDPSSTRLATLEKNHRFQKTSLSCENIL